MMLATAVQERGYINKFPVSRTPGAWHWSLTGPAPQSIDLEDGGGVQFEIDEIANPGEYIVTVQRVDLAGSPMGDFYSSQAFTISQDVEATVDVEVAGPVTVTISKKP